MTPAPREAPRVSATEPHGAVEPPRRVYCPLYDDCLDHAIRNNWASFQCDRCKVDLEISPLQQQSDMYGIAEVFTAIMQPEGSRAPHRRQRPQEDD